MVKVAKHPTTGNVITQSENNAEYGTVRLDSEHTSFENGFINTSNRSAFIRGKMTDLAAVFKTEGQVLVGKIKRQESFDLFWAGQEPKINPTTTEIVLKNGRPVYMQHVFTEDTKAPDEWGTVTVDETTGKYTFHAGAEDEISEEVQNALADQQQTGAI